MLLKDFFDQETGLQYFESLIKYVFSNVDGMTTERIHSIVPNTLILSAKVLPDVMTSMDN